MFPNNKSNLEGAADDHRDPVVIFDKDCTNCSHQRTCRFSFHALNFASSMLEDSKKILKEEVAFIWCNTLAVFCNDFEVKRDET